VVSWVAPAPGEPWPGMRGRPGRLRKDVPGMAHWIAGLRFTPAAGEATRRRRSGGLEVKAGIHPEYVPTTVTCTCGNTFVTRSTAKNGVLHADVCSNCHPFYTGKQKILDTGGRVARFERRYAKSQGAEKKARKK